MKKAHVLFVALVLCLPAQLTVLAQTAPPAPPPATPHATPHTASQQDPGERAFKANCARCHSAPEQLSPHISGTVVMHMRVRANLSSKDSQDILRYLAP